MKPDEKRFSLVELAATLDDVLSLGRGDPDLDTSADIIENACKKMTSPPEKLEVKGLFELRSAIAEHYMTEQQLDFDPDNEILVTNGAQEGLFLSVLALLDPGDEILVPDPRYGSYDQAITTAGGKMVPLPTGKDYDFSITPEIVAGTEGGKVLLLVNPSNPTGALTTNSNIRQLSQLAIEKDLIVISDEVYSQLTFGKEKVLSIASCQGMRDRTVTLSSFSKTYAMTGFRVGYLLGPPPFINAVTKLKSNISGPTALFSQYAALSALEGSQENIKAANQIYAERLRVMTTALEQYEVPYGKPGGGFFLWADISKFGLDAENFCHQLLTEERVLMFPGTAFGENWKSYVRISLLQPKEKMHEATERIGSFLRKLLNNA